MISHVQTNIREETLKSQTLSRDKSSSVSLGLLILVIDISPKAFHWYFTKILPVF